MLMTYPNPLLTNSLALVLAHFHAAGDRLGASLSQAYCHRGIRSAQDVVAQCLLTRSALPVVNGESYYILTPIWYNRRVRSTICDSVIGLSDRGSLEFKSEVVRVGIN